MMNFCHLLPRQTMNFRFFRQSVHTGDNVELDTFDAFDFVTKVEHVQLVRLYQKEGETVDLLSNVCSGIDKEGQGAQSPNRLCTKNFWIEIRDFNMVFSSIVHCAGKCESVSVRGNCS